MGLDIAMYAVDKNNLDEDLNIIDTDKAIYIYSWGKFWALLRWIKQRKASETCAVILSREDLLALREACDARELRETEGWYSSPDGSITMDGYASVYEAVHLARQHIDDDTAIVVWYSY
jgi:hypothetical protein